LTRFAEQLESLSPKRLALLCLELQEQLDARERREREAIAVIGIGCRFPGGVDSPETFWELLAAGTDATTEVPADRWEAHRYYDPTPGVPGKMYTHRGGFLHNVDQFDPHFFGISPREASEMDPQHRLLLEVGWEALERAGHAARRLAGTRTGVYVGVSASDYLWVQGRSGDLTRINAYTGTGNAISCAAGRLSYHLGLQGPSLSLDTACSSSLVAVHLACQSLRNRECELALAGGVNLLLAPECSVFLSSAQALSPDGRCKTFDARADGYGRSEGCGLVVLRRLSAALAAGDNVLALIRGSAVNHDGHSSGLTVPNGPAQVAVLRAALEGAGVRPTEVQYVEAHGTGTPLGDPIEVQSLAEVLGAGRGDDDPVWLGSVKTNIGHSEPAAGVAGLIKVVLALGRRQIPAHLHFQRLNPHISLEQGPFRVPTTLEPWTVQEGRRIAGVSAFGLSGTNAHVVLEEAPEPPPATSAAAGERPWQLLALSAPVAPALRQLAERLEHRLGAGPPLRLGDVCHTANAGRPHFAQRLAVMARSVEELREGLGGFLRGTAGVRVRSGEVRTLKPLRVVLLCTGQGSQYVGMGRGLYGTEPIFRRVLDRCDEVLRPELEVPLLRILYPAAGETSPLDQTAYAQPALFALGVALAELWRSWGIVPAAVLGHSVGEYVAACVAGVFSLEEGASLVAHRGRLMQAMPAGGAMVALTASEAQVAAAIGHWADRLAVAAVNGPASTVLSGAADAVAAVVQELAQTGVRHRPLQVSHAFHSPLMEPALARFAERLQQVRFAEPRIDLISNLTGREATAEEICRPEYWCRQARQPVRFADGLATLQRRRFEVFVEAGPSPVLLGMARRVLPEGTVGAPSLRPGRDDGEQILESLGELYVAGARVEWEAVDPGRGRRKVVLPTYPWQHRRYWVEGVIPASGDDTAASAAGPPIPREPLEGPPVHPLLGRRLAPVAAHPELHTWQLDLDLKRLSFLEDHRVGQLIVASMAFFLEVAVAAGKEVFGAGAPSVQGLRLENPLPLSATVPRLLQVTVSPPEEEKRKLAVHSRLANSATGRWTLHATAELSPAPALLEEAVA
jgi:acyl transferase domain-containing protein